MQLSALYPTLALVASTLVAGQSYVKFTSPTYGDVVKVGSSWNVTWNTNSNEKVHLTLSGGQDPTNLTPCGQITDSYIDNIGTMRWDVMEFSPDGNEWKCDAWKNPQSNTIFSINVNTEHEGADHWSDSFTIQH